MEKISNFHEISERRKRGRKAKIEFGEESAIFEEHYKTDLEEAESQASQFKVADFGGLGSAKEILKKQKAEDETGILSDSAHIDRAAIVEATPEIGDVQTLIQYIARLKASRMRKMFEILNTKIPRSAKEKNEAVIQSINKEIAEAEKKLTEANPSILRQAQLIEYNEQLAMSGHICITPNTGKDLEAIGDRMLTGKPMFLHGPTGTGKTSLARFAASHFTGKDAEMVFCNPQTKESHVWGKTALKPTKDGRAFFTYLDLGPLVKAMKEGKTVIFDEFTALPKEQMVFIKAVFHIKPGDTINVIGDGLITVASGFQMIFTANLKSEKNPERQEMPPEITREFEQNNLEVQYTELSEAYDIMLPRLLNRDGSLDMSFYDLHTTLPNLCRAMADIQEFYTNETNKETAKKAGAMDAAGKMYSLKKFVMTQGSVEAILEAWLVEKKVGKKERSFSEFLDERLKIALTFKEYPKEDRILAAKILASRGFLLTLTAKDLNVPEDIFQFQPIKAMRGEDAVEELRKSSGAVQHLTLKEVAELDPFGKRAELLKGRADALLGVEDGEEDLFVKDLRKRYKKLFGEKKGNTTPEISTVYTYTNPETNKVERQETISLDIEAKLQEFLSFYNTTHVDFPPDFEDTMRDIWNRNYDDIREAIEQNGYDDLLLIPPTSDIGDLSEKMKMEQGYHDYIQSNVNVQTLRGIPLTSQNTNKPRILLVHNAQNLQDHPELKKTLNIKGEDVNLNHIPTLEDYLIFQRIYFEETGKHLDEIGWTWLATKSGTRLVDSYWNPGHRELRVGADVFGTQDDGLGARSSRCFF